MSRGARRQSRPGRIGSPGGWSYWTSGGRRRAGKGPVAGSRTVPRKGPAVDARRRDPPVLPVRLGQDPPPALRDDRGDRGPADLPAAPAGPGLAVRALGRLPRGRRAVRRRDAVLLLLL